MMFNAGDRYVHFTKYGSVNKGEVKSVGSSVNWDTENGVAYYDTYIVSTKNIILKLDGSDGRIYKLKEGVTEEDVNKWKRSATIFAELKRRKNESENNIS